MKSTSWFTPFAQGVAKATGNPLTFIAAVLVLLAWAVSGFLFSFSDTWQLVINTGTTIITFLMVFIIQNTQNRDTTAIQIKLDELIRALHGANDEMLDLDELDDKTLERLKGAYEKLAVRAETALGSEELPKQQGHPAGPSPRKAAVEPDGPKLDGGNPRE